MSPPSIEIDDGAFLIEASVVATGLDVGPAQVLILIRSGGGGSNLLNERCAVARNRAAYFDPCRLGAFISPKQLSGRNNFISGDKGDLTHQNPILYVWKGGKYVPLE